MALTGPEKAVLMLLSLDEATAAPIVAELDDGDLRKLREVAAMMRAVPASAIDEVYGEFVERAQQEVAVPRGGVSYLKRLAARARGETGSQEIFMDAPESGLAIIQRSDPVAVASLLEREHPQIIAAIMSQLDPARAARVLEQLPQEKQSNVLMRLGSITEVPAGLLEEIASAMAAELPTTGMEASLSVDGVSRAAGLVRKLNKEAAADLLNSLNEQQPEVATEIRRAMFTFEDLKTVNQRELRTILKEVQADRLVLALRTASDAVKQKIFASMSQRAVELIKDDLTQSGAVRLSEVEAAQREIVETALRLEQEGAIVLGGEGDAMV